MEWISIEDETPKDRTLVLGCNKGGVPMVGLISKHENGRVEIYYDDYYMYITHWMLLPPSPVQRNTTFTEREQ